MDDLLDLRRVAMEVDARARPWIVHNERGYPQTVLRKGDVVLVAQTFCEDPDRPNRWADFIATFDPPTVLRLLDRLMMAERRYKTEPRVGGDIL